MTKLLLCLVCAAVGLPVLDAPADPPAPPRLPAPRQTAPDQDENAPLGANFVVALSKADNKGQPELAILTATQTFGSYCANSNGGQQITFNARLIPQENGVFLLTYQLNTDSDRAITKSSVLLRPGEVVQIIKNGDQFYNLKLDRYTPTPTAKGGTDGDKSGPGIGFMR